MMHSDSHQCSKCDENFKSLLKLATHFNKEHDQVNDRKQCPVCPKNYQNTAMLNIHLKSVHLNVKKKCKICDKIFALGAFRGHMDEVHGNGNSSELIKCDLCEYSTTLKRNYRKHVRQMHTKREKLLLCDQCDLRLGQCKISSFIPKIIKT